jgi:hypothetical protein
VSIAPAASAVNEAFERQTLPTRSTLVAVSATVDPGATPRTVTEIGTSSRACCGSASSTAVPAWLLSSSSVVAIGAWVLPATGG